MGNATIMTGTNSIVMTRTRNDWAVVPQTAQFEEATIPYLDSVFRTAHTLLSNLKLAEQVTQATFAEAWNRRQAMDGNIRVWLFSLLLPQIRKRRSWFRRPGPRSAGDQIVASLQTLPREQGEVVLLADAEGFSGSEIAAILGRELASVQRLLEQGRAGLEKTSRELETN